MYGKLPRGTYFTIAPPPYLSFKNYLTRIIEAEILELNDVIDVYFIISDFALLSYLQSVLL